MIFNTQGIFEWLAERSLAKKIQDIIVMCTLLGSGLMVWNFAEKAFAHKISFTDTYNNSILINEELSKTRHLTSADVVLLYRYHNGTNGINGFSFIKKSITDMDKDTNYSFDVASGQNIPISSDLKQLNEHINGECTITRVTSTLQLYPMLNKQGLKQYVTCPVYDYNHILIGYIMAGYTTTDKEIDTYITTQIKSAANEVGLIT